MTSLPDHVKNALDKEFEVGDVVAFNACPDTLFEITDGGSPFWNLEHLYGPELPDNYYKTCFGVDRPDTASVIETVLFQPNEMYVLAVMSQDPK